MIRWFVYLLLIHHFFTSYVSCNNVVDKDLLSCLEKGTCGIKSLCSFAFTYQEACVPMTSDDVYRDNDTATRNTAPKPPPSTTRNNLGVVIKPDCSNDGTIEYTVEGNVMQLKNGLDKTLDYTWNVVGYAYDTKTDDMTARRFILSSYSTAFFDTGIPFRHTVRLEHGSQVINTELSSKRQCTTYEACQYLLKVCQSSFVFLNTQSLEPKLRCLQYSKACGFFDSGSSKDTSKRLPPFNSPSDEDEDEDEDDNKDENEKDSAVSLIPIARSESNQCITECIWTIYPKKYLPPLKTTVSESIDSLDLLRRIYLDLTTNLKDTSDKEFIDDKVNIFKTSDSDDSFDSMYYDSKGHRIHSDHSGNENSKTTAVALLATVIALMLLCFLCICLYKFKKRYKKHYDYYFQNTIHDHERSDDDGDDNNNIERI